MESLTALVVIVVFLIFIISILVFVRLLKLLNYIGIRIEKCRKFIDENEGFFTILFVLIFTAEQILLIVFTTIFKENSSILRLIISIFALFVITTASLQKFVIETKRRYEKEREIAAENTIKMLSHHRTDAKKLHEIIKSLVEEIKRLKQK